jgi:hypothetical protein
MLLSIQSTSSTPYAELLEIEIYEFVSCEDLIPVHNEVIDEPLAVLDFHLFNLSNNTEYLIVLKRTEDNGFPVAYFGVKFQNYLTAACPTSYDNCGELIKNRKFNSTIISPINGSEAFSKGEVCEWDDAFGTCDYYINGNETAATLIHNSIDNCSSFQSYSEGLRQNIVISANTDYYLSFSLKRSSISTRVPPKSFKVYLANQNDLNNLNIYPPTNPNGSRKYCDFITLSNKEEVASVLGSNIQTNSYSNFTFCFSTMNTYDAIVFVPIPDGLNNLAQNEIYLDNISLKEFEEIEMASEVELECGFEKVIGPECIYEGADYLWSPTTGLSDPTIPNPIASPSQTTNYQLAVTIPNSPCTLTSNVNVINTVGGPMPTKIPDGRDVNWLTNNLPHLQGDPTFFYGLKLYVEGDLYIDYNVNSSDPVLFDNCEIYMAKNARIIVSDDAELRLLNGTKIQNCYSNERWDGVYLKGVTNGKLSTGGNVEINGSTNGIVVEDGAEFGIVNTHFNNNLQSIYIKTNNGTPGSNIFSNYLINTSTFDYTDIPASSYPNMGIKIENWYGNSTHPVVQFTGNTVKGEAGRLHIIDSDVFIDQSTFEGFQNEFNIYSGKTKSYQSVFINGKEGTLSNAKVKITNTTFNDNALAIDCRRNIDLEIASCSTNFNGSNLFTTGFAVISGNEQSVTMDLCTLKNISGGVSMWDVSNASITNNIFDMEVQSGSGYSSRSRNSSRAIFVNNFDVSPNYSSSPNVNISDNIIEHSKIGIQTEFAYANIQSNDILNLNDNQFDPGCPPYQICDPIPTPYGIRAMNEVVYIKENKVENDASLYGSSQPSANTQIVGISLENVANLSDDAIVNCNKVENIGIGLRFVGDNGTGTIVERNSMQDHYWGFVLKNNGKIGNVGSNGIASDNEWNGIDYDASRTFADNSDGSLSILYVQNSSVHSKFDPPTFDCCLSL